MLIRVKKFARKFFNFGPKFRLWRLDHERNNKRFRLATSNADGFATLLGFVLASSKAIVLPPIELLML
jgi:hypothetical protein